MHISIEIKNMTDTDLQPLQILVAESDPVEIDRIVATIDREFHAGIKIAKNYQQLLERTNLERPQLVVLGKIDNANYSEIAQACHKIKPKLPIYLLSSQGIIIDSFRQLVKTCGLTDVITRDANSLNQLLVKIDPARRDRRTMPSEKLTTAHPNRQQLTSEPLGSKPTPNVTVISADRSLIQPKIFGRDLLAALDEIVTVSNSYFGPLAQGNYWRKAHDRIIDEFPAMQNWSADHFSKLSCHENMLVQEITPEDLQSLRVWVRLFIEECERIIIDYRSILTHANLSPLATDLLIRS
ncbi:hypothetical protein [Chamaesiphon sp. OTE_8_metabat_110]|uniref:hypothetical protein n=1 Tax=Chamaesiphon sp. OTE_8_metabat_110 TaxID=2964696 RepID=UPI00286B9DD1|nr:hypothetical protein [Chamaesiphon sp. OTE_8_metabat_110]